MSNNSHSSFESRSLCFNISAKIRYPSLNLFSIPRRPPCSCLDGISERMSCQELVIFFANLELSWANVYKILLRGFMIKWFILPNVYGTNSKETRNYDSFSLLLKAPVMVCLLLSCFWLTVWKEVSNVNILLFYSLQLILLLTLVAGIFLIRSFFVGLVSFIIVA